MARAAGRSAWTCGGVEPAEVVILDKVGQASVLKERAIEDGLKLVVFAGKGFPARMFAQMSLASVRMYNSLHKSGDRTRLPPCHPQVGDEVTP